MHETTRRGQFGVSHRGEHVHRLLPVHPASSAALFEWDRVSKRHRPIWTPEQDHPFYRVAVQLSKSAEILLRLGRGGVRPESGLFATAADAPVRVGNRRLEAFQTIIEP